MTEIKECAHCGEQADFMVATNPMVAHGGKVLPMCATCWNRFRQKKGYSMTIWCPNCDVVIGLPPSFSDWLGDDPENSTERDRLAYIEYIHREFPWTNPGFIVRTESRVIVRQPEALYGKPLLPDGSVLDER